MKGTGGFLEELGGARGGSWEVLAGGSSRARESWEEVGGIEWVREELGGLVGALVVLGRVEVA